MSVSSRSSLKQQRQSMTQPSSSSGTGHFNLSVSHHRMLATLHNFLQNDLSLAGKPLFLPEIPPFIIVVTLSYQFFYCICDRCINRNQQIAWGQPDKMLVGKLWWTGIPSRGRRNTPSRFVQQKPEIRAGTDEPLARPITIETNFTFTLARSLTKRFRHCFSFHTFNCADWHSDSILWPYKYWLAMLSLSWSK